MSRILVALGILLVTGGLLVQHRWNVQCDAQVRGQHWDSDNWTCK